ncbi:helix-turn-helix transcriptional regulator [Demequina oxidasica]|uniref:helix-turn-helix transcriptional regulator n=1 Tax=Demequina oxidasica TaxID=676199 RepID=UPI0007837183|nr:WYL domain-containing protein [Demequina oxidasica]
MAEKALPRLTRLLGIMTYVQDEGEAPFVDLAEKFDVSVETIRKDINALWASGLPGYAGGDLIDFDSYLFDQDVASIIDSQGVTQVRLSTREGVALVGALASMIASGAAPAVASSARDKIGEMLGADDPVVVQPIADVDHNITASLQDAVTRGRVIDVEYVDAADHRTSRTIEPHRLVAIDGVAYVECFCRRAQDYRTLRIGRIVGVQVRNEEVIAPPADSSGFTLVSQFEATVVAARGSRWVLEDLPGVKIEDVGDDVRATFDVVDVDWVADRLLAIAPYLRAVEPKSVRAALAQHANAVLATVAG